MYENIGTKTMTLAKVMGILSIAGGIIGFFVFAMAELPWAGFATLISGVIGFVSTWMVYCIGETREEIEMLRREIKALRSAEAKAEEAEAVKRVQIPIQPVMRDAAPAGVSNPSIGKWRCTCGRENPEYVSTCVCGANRREL